MAKNSAARIMDEMTDAILEKVGESFEPILNEWEDDNASFEWIMDPSDENAIEKIHKEFYQKYSEFLFYFTRGYKDKEAPRRDFNLYAEMRIQRKQND